jgi:hypothetical protein
MTTSPFTDEEKTEILRFLGYADWASLAQSIQLGFPAASQPMFLVFDSFKRITPTARAQVRHDVGELRCIEQQLSEARNRFRAMELEGLKLNPREPMQLRQELSYWTNRLADDLGVKANPYSQMGYVGMPGGINAKVSG